MSAAALAGAAVLARVLDCMGDPEANDHVVAKIIVDGEIDLQALLAFAVAALAKEFAS